MQMDLVDDASVSEQWTAGAVLVTGAASGIGRAVAVLCAERGASVVAIDVDPAGLRTLSDEALTGHENTLVAIECDVSAEDQVADAFRQARSVVGPIHGVVASAGIEINVPLHELAVTQWDRVQSVNLRGVFLTCKYALKAMLADGVPGSVVCLSSPAAFVGFAGGGNSPYAASKGGVSALVRSMAIDYAADGIRVNAVVPGATDTAMLLAGAPIEGRVSAREALIARATAEIPLRRVAQPTEIAHAIAWLLSDEASYVTGSHLVCDGGLLAKSANSF